MAIAIQLLLVSIWGATLTLHTRRLLRLAVVPSTANRSRYLRGKAERVWWWLGRDEFWEGALHDVVRCTEVTLLVAVLALSL